MRTSRHLVAVSFLFLAACAAAPNWIPPPPDVPTTWRDRQLYVGPHAFVLATDADDAAELHELATALATGLAAALGSAPKPGLWIALGDGDPLPTDHTDAAAYLRALPNWFERTSGEPAPPAVSTEIPVRGRDPVQLDPAAVARLATAPVPKDATELSLPTALTDAVAFVAITPTDACLDQATSELTDAAIEASGTPSWQVTAASLVVGHPATMMWKEMVAARRTLLGHVWLHALAATPAQAAAAWRALGQPDLAEQALLPSRPRAAVDQTALVAKITIAAPDGRVVIGSHPIPPLQKDYARMPWRTVIDLAHDPDREFAALVRAAGNDYVELPCLQQPPDAEFCRRLDAVLQQHASGTVFVCAADAELAGAVMALHGHHCRGLDAAATVALARHFRVFLALPMVREVVGLAR